MNHTQILEMPASDLIGRLVLNPNGVEFVVTALTFDARSGQVIIQIDDIDGHTGAPAGDPTGLHSLQGWPVTGSDHNAT